MVHPLETYLQAIKRIYSTGGGTKEESYYGSLEVLLNDIGHRLKPKVFCVQQLQNTGSGEPDFGLYVSSQKQAVGEMQILQGQIPERGVVEAKGWTENLSSIVSGTQVKKYLDRYGLLLLTNYREFGIVARNAGGKVSLQERFALAENSDSFVALFSHPQASAKLLCDRFDDFLTLALRRNAPLYDPQDLAWFLASYAREARGRVEARADLPAFESLKNALEEALGMKFTGDKAEHFFQATFVQTLFYGIFSAWVLWSRKPHTSGEKFNWHETQWQLNVPLLSSLFSQIATKDRLEPLGVAEVLDWATATLNRVEWDRFIQKFEDDMAVQYFYEPFLKAYDPELRKELGVWYTPPEIVKYQVERVDRVLREELQLADGLADPQVLVLDPCCGTGAYLVETLRRIHLTLVEKGGEGLAAQKMKQAALERVFGFEILPAPYVVSHLQLGLLMQKVGAPLRPDKGERAGVYLTNALTGWDPPQDPKNRLSFLTELAQEREAADSIKRDKTILVVLGNPPYNAFAGISPAEENGLVEPYKESLGKPTADGGWGIKKYNLDDLYVRFFRIAERRILKTGKGVVSFISNYSWTSEPSFVVMRKLLLDSFDRFWIENMHGNRKISEYGPDGSTSETIFAIPGFSSGIRQGVVVSLMVKRDDSKGGSGENVRVLYREDVNASRAAQRRIQLLKTLKAIDFDDAYQVVSPSKENRYSFRPESVSKQYRDWPSVIDLCHVPPSNGLMEKRGGALIDVERKALESRMRRYFDKSVDWESYRSLQLGLEIDRAGIDPKQVRTNALSLERYQAERIVRYAIRPFDFVWCYYTSASGVWNRARPSYWAQCWPGNSFFVTRPTCPTSPEGANCYFTSSLGDNDFQRGHSYYFPVRCAKQPAKGNSVSEKQTGFELNASHVNNIVANLSAQARQYLLALGVKDMDANHESAEVIWMHALAVCYAPKYLQSNADGIRRDWPRIPLPHDRKPLLLSAELGRRVSELLNPDQPIAGLNSGKIEEYLKSLGTLKREGSGQVDPHEGDLDVSAGWGHRGKDDACMPGQGRLSTYETKDSKQAAFFGMETLDIYLNESVYWSNVPKSVWNFYIGGYQVIKKWLSYREKAILGRGLTIAEAEYVTDMTRRIAALVVLQPKLDENYLKTAAHCWPFDFSQKK